MVRVAQPADPLEAQHLLGVLEEHGIRAVVQGEALWAARGELPFGPESAPSLWVTDEADAERARQILANHKSLRQRTYCARCGHELRGEGETRCPTCDTPIRMAATWACPNCREEIETQFTNCWNCGRQRGDTAASTRRDDRGPVTESAPPCARCGGKGYVERQLMPAILLACGLFLGFAALHNAFGHTSLGGFRIDAFLPRTFYALVAVLCLYFARRLHRTACPCRDE